MIIFILVVVGILIFLMHTKIEFIRNRNGCEKISAEVIEYRKEKSPMRNDYTLLEYPYVRICDGDEYILRKLRYANNWQKPFKIGERIDVFWLGNDLLYWNAFDKGIYTFLPEKWFRYKSKNA